MNALTTGLALCAVALAGLLVASSRSSTHARLLSDAEMRATVGGVQVNSFDIPPVDNSLQDQDNPQFTLNVLNPSANSGWVALFEGSSKYASSVVTWKNGASGLVQMRSPNWPINATKRDITLKYYDQNAWSNAGGASTRNDFGLYTGLKVAKVRFYHLQEVGGVNPTSVGHSLSGLIDHTATFVYDWRTTPSVDAIAGQCTQDKKWNFRYDGVYSETVPAGCTNIRTDRGCGAPGQPACSQPPDDWTPGDQCPNWYNSIKTVIDARIGGAGLNSKDYVHVVFVNSFWAWGDRDNDGVNEWRAYSGWAPPPPPGALPDNFVLVLDTLNEFEMSSLIAHEIGHKQGLCHPDALGTPPCTQATNDCTAPSDRNLMCSSVGRELVSSQCNITGPNTQFRDWL